MKKLSINKALQLFNRGQEITVCPKGLSTNSGAYNANVTFSKKLCEDLQEEPNFLYLIQRYERYNYPRRAEFYLAE